MQPPPARGCTGDARPIQWRDVTGHAAGRHGAEPAGNGRKSSHIYGKLDQGTKCTGAQCEGTQALQIPQLQESLRGHRLRRFVAVLGG